MARSLRKGPYVDPRLFEKVQRAQAGGSREPIKTWARRCTVPPEFVGLTFEVHNGKVFKKVLVTEDMVGHKLGEFSLTRTWRGHTPTRKKAP
jgi:small subunit ribosomal protein S19